MSYNPAFVADESPLASTPGANGDHSNGIKLTSFKPLPAGLLLDASELARDSGAASAASRRPDRIQAGGDKCTSGTTKLAAKKSGAKRAARGSTGATNLLLSTSSSLSLIDNPSTLSSLTPSASSYSTTTSNSSIVSTTTGLCAAVECRDMRYDVGRGKSNKTILHDINVTVPEGSIYGLLGPSGCGKTTMLRCVVGRIKPKAGFVRVFGYRPNESGSQIPGPAIGYMPQVSWLAAEAGLGVQAELQGKTRARAHIHTHPG